MGRKRRPGLPKGELRARFEHLGDPGFDILRFYVAGLHLGSLVFSPLRTPFGCLGPGGRFLPPLCLRSSLAKRFSRLIRSLSSRVTAFLLMPRRSYGKYFAVLLSPFYAKTLYLSWTNLPTSYLSVSIRA